MLDSESQATAIMLDSESQATAIMLDSESQATAIMLDSESQATAIMLDSESQATVKNARLGESSYGKLIALSRLSHAGDKNSLTRAHRPSSALKPRFHGSEQAIVT